MQLGCSPYAEHPARVRCPSISCSRAVESSTPPPPAIPRPPRAAVTRQRSSKRSIAFCRDKTHAVIPSVARDLGGVGLEDRACRPLHTQVPRCPEDPVLFKAVRGLRAV